MTFFSSAADGDDDQVGGRLVLRFGKRLDGDAAAHHLDEEATTVGGGRHAFGADDIGRQPGDELLELRRQIDAKRKQRERAEGSEDA